jgi:hypothetical protein
MQKLTYSTVSETPNLAKSLSIQELEERLETIQIAPQGEDSPRCGHIIVNENGDVLVL